jgi:predicted nuclease of predicted toxin-antitoxin system
MKFLVDECLSPKLAVLARARGHPESSHVVWLGQSGIEDWNLVTFAVNGDWTLVTKNSYDFRGPADAPGAGGYYRNVPIHPGLVCLNAADMNREMQIAIFGAVLDAIEEDGDLVNIGLEAALLPTGEIEIERYGFTGPSGVPT